MYVLSHFSLVRLFVTPWIGASQTPLSMGFFRQEYWSGLPWPPPGDLPDPRIKPRSPSLQAHSLPSASPGKPRNTGVGSLFPLHGIFLTQELNWGLLHCRQILHQLSYQGSPPCAIHIYIAETNPTLSSNYMPIIFFEKERVVWGLCSSNTPRYHNIHVFISVFLPSSCSNPIHSVRLLCPPSPSK